MLERRRIALAGLEEGDGDLLIEWSAPPTRSLEDVDAWRLASPHWTPKRERLICKRLAGGEAGRGRPGGRGARPRADLPLPVAEPVAAKPGAAAGEDRRPAPGRGSGSRSNDSELGEAPLIVALEDDFGRGAAVGAVWRLEDGRIAVDGWTTWTGTRDRRRRAPARLAPGLGALRRRLPARPDAEGGLRAATGRDAGGARRPGRLPRPGRDRDAGARGHARAGHGDRADAGPRVAHGPRRSPRGRRT